MTERLSLEKMSAVERAQVDHAGHLVEELLSQVQMNKIMVMKMVITLMNSFECVYGGIGKSCKTQVTPFPSLRRV